MGKERTSNVPPQCMLPGMSGEKQGYIRVEEDGIVSYIKKVSTERGRTKMHTLQNGMCTELCTRHCYPTIDDVDKDGFLYIKVTPQQSID